MYELCKKKHVCQGGEEMDKPPSTESETQVLWLNKMGFCSLQFDIVMVQKWLQKHDLKTHILLWIKFLFVF